MILNINKRKRLIIIVIAIVIALIPIVITIFDLAATDKESIVFLEDYPASITVLILLYYLALFIISVLWLIKQIIEFVKLKNEKSKAELLHLKSQVNPHFFFNTLNNLYGLVAVDPIRAQELILKLSDMMRYSIYEGEKDVVTLKDEIAYLKNYIELHKMRYHKQIDIDFKYQIDEDYKVMPLLFIILLENAFKHGVENLSEKAFVDINISTFDNKVKFEIKNNFDDAEVLKEKGIGLKNLKRRLELVYPNKHKLSFLANKNEYKAILILHQL